MRFSGPQRLSADNLRRVVLFASYERRCLQVARELSDAGYRGEATILYCADAATPAVMKSLEELQRLFDGRYLTKAVSVSDPRPMIELARGWQDEMETLVDVTCFTRGNLFSMLWGWGLGRVKRLPLVFGYSPASAYGPWLTRDFERPQNMVGFGGPPVFQKERVLVCLVGFDGDRAWALIEHLEPSRVILCVGSNPTRTEFVEKNKSAVDMVRHRVECEILELSVTDPNATLSALDQILVSIGDDRSVHLAPFNNKLSCIATYACWLEHQDIRLWNAVPSTYNFRGYSRGSSVPRYFAVEW